MKLTNKYNIPDAIAESIRNDPYDKGKADFSVTELIKPSQIVALEKMYADEIEEDVIDRIWSLYGQIAHGILERAGDQSLNLVEKRIFKNVFGHIISGQIDTLSLKDGVLSDYKFTTAYKFNAKKETPEEWSAQLNMQAFLLWPEYKIKKLQIVGLLRDWQIAKAESDFYYPPQQIAIMDIKLWTQEKTLNYIKSRISSHNLALSAKKPSDLKPCSSEEHWNYRRCQSYCKVSKWCAQYNLKKGKTDG